MGVPLITRDNEVFGTLCGLSSRAQPRTLARFLPIVEMSARLLSTLGPEEPAQRVASSARASILDRPT
jgi:hypothetical protein